MASFVRLLDNIKQLEEINHQLSIHCFLEEKEAAGQEQVRGVAQMLQFMEKGLLASIKRDQR